MSALATSSAAPARLGFTSSVSTRVRSAAARVPSQPTKQRGACPLLRKLPRALHQHALSAHRLPPRKHAAE